MWHIFCKIYTGSKGIIVSVLLRDHLGGFDKNLYNDTLYHLNKQSVDNPTDITFAYIPNYKISQTYSNLNFHFNMTRASRILGSLKKYNIHPEIEYKNFVCSFNGGDHVSRQLLSSILNNQRHFNPAYSSKNFAYSNNWIVGHLDGLDLLESESKLYSKLFINNDEFNNNVYSFGHVRYKHDKNIHNLENKLTQSFVHIVSETMATSYYPFVTEKFLYSVVTRGLFLAYAQPRWHVHLEKYHGFKLYDKIFDYSFDVIQNPVKRLVRLMEIISKFSTLSTDDWRDLYLMEQDAIEYNYEHYFSGDYLKHLAQYE